MWQPHCRVMCLLSLNIFKNKYLCCLVHCLISHTGSFSSTTSCLHYLYLVQLFNGWCCFPGVFPASTGEHSTQRRWLGRLRRTHADSLSTDTWGGFAFAVWTEFTKPKIPSMNSLAVWVAHNGACHTWTCYAMVILRHTIIGFEFEFSKV